MAVVLKKGQRISLKKENGTPLTHMCLGINWGAIEKKGLFGGTRKVAVDLDASIGLFDKNKRLIETVYFGALKSSCGAIRHSGDDLTGDVDGDDGLDNEIISIDLTRINANVDHLALILNSFKGQDFHAIPFAAVRIFEGTLTSVEKVFATFDIANDAQFAGKVSMVLGKLYRHSEGWKFHSIGEPTRDKNLMDTLDTFANQFI